MPRRLVGASRAEQLTQNIAALDIVFTPDQQTVLDEASTPPSLNPYFILTCQPVGCSEGRRRSVGPDA